MEQYVVFQKQNSSLKITGEFDESVISVPATSLNVAFGSADVPMTRNDYEGFMTYRDNLSSFFKNILAPMIRSGLGLPGSGSSTSYSTSSKDE